MRYNAFKTYDQRATLVDMTAETAIGGTADVDFERVDENIEIRGVHMSGRTGMVRFWSATFYPANMWWINLRTAGGDVIFHADPESVALEEGQLFETFSVTPKLNPLGQVEEYEYIITVSDVLLPAEEE